MRYFMTEHLSGGLEIAEACEVRCVTVPPRAGEQALIEVLTALNEAETRQEDSARGTGVLPVVHAGTLVVFIHGSFVQVSVRLSTETWSLQHTTCPTKPQKIIKVLKISFKEKKILLTLSFKISLICCLYR